MKLTRRIAAAATAPLVIGAVSVGLADSASAYSVPTRVNYGQACTAGHSEGLTPNRTVITLTNPGSLSCGYKVEKYRLWQLQTVSYIHVDKIVKRCPGAPIQMIC